MEIEACASVEKELDRFIGKLESLREDTCTEIEDIASLLSEMLDILAQAERDLIATINTSTQVDVPPNVDDPMVGGANMQVENEPVSRRLTEAQVEVLADNLSKVLEKLQHISADHRELHGSVSKVGKAIDRNLVSDFSSTMRVDVLQEDDNMMLLNKVIAKHYCRQGMDEVARLLIKESKMPEDMAKDVFDSERSFAEIYRIWKQIQNRELGAALQWAETHADKLSKNSVLEFKLHRLAFLQIVARGVSAQTEAINYARKNFIKFADRFEHEIPNLMGCFIYLPLGLEYSPYRHLFSSDIFTEVSYIFLKDACSALGISKNSALSVVINAGCTALPALLNIKQVMQSRQVLGVWNGCDELPIEIDLDPEYRFHSIFACPILRQQTSEDNPPKKLTCGHVISNDALHKLSNGHILKCPYCPVEQNAEEAVRIYF